LSVRRETTATRFFVGVGLGLLPAVAFGVLGLLFLRNTYESASHEDIVATQVEKGGIYGSALRDDFFEYKVALFRATKPRIVSIGSSRAWGIQQRGFREPFVSLGGPVRSVKDGERLLASMRAEHHMPEVVLFAIDYWWFNDAWNPDDKRSSYKEEVEDVLGKPFRPAMWLYTAKVGVRDFVDVSLHASQVPAPLPPAYGVLARYSLHGFAPDGHYSYLGDAFGLIAPDKHFDQAVAQIRKGTSRYVFGRHASQERVERFRALVRGFEAAGARVITYIPPVSSVVRAEIARQGEKLAYVQETLEALHREQLAAYDFHDPTSIGGTDCEFIDGYHGGEVLNLRIVRAIASDPRSRLADHVDLPAIDQAIAHASGHVLVDGDRYAPYKEVDFLDLRCPK